MWRDESAPYSRALRLLSAQSGLVVCPHVL